MVSTPPHLQSATTIFLDEPPSCLEFGPASPNHFIVGTYLLSETRTEDGDIHQKKTGSLQLWELNPDSNTLSQIQRISLPYAVFDLHFHSQHPELLAITSSVGSVALFKLASRDSCSRPEIKLLWTRPVHEDPSTPALFLEWTPRDWLPDSRDGFAVTFSDGGTSIFGTSPENDSQITDASSITELGNYNARQTIEVWVVALAMYQNNCDDGVPVRIPFMFTGNDFGSLHTRRFNMNGASEGDSDGDQTVLPSLLLDHDDRARHHTAGVTSILPLPFPLVDGAPLLLTGSYDEYLRVYHATPKGNTLAEVCLGGGVWRLQLLHTETAAVASKNEGCEWRFLVLVSCMHAGTRVVRVTCRQQDGNHEWTMHVLAEFTEHESMNYASGAWKGTKRHEGLVCVSSSFYDRRLCLWRVEV